jgi:nucleoside-diphosphate-sugar epimerase
VDGVFHIAAMFREADQPDSAYFAANVEGVRNVLEAAEAAGVQRVVHCSTGGVHGHIANPPADESAPFEPGDVYQQSKVDGEVLALEFFRQGRVRGVVIRPGMIYGPGDTRTGKIFRMISRGMFFYVGRGDNLVHFIDVRDLARAFLLAMDHEETNAEVYIIAGERTMSLREFCEIVAARLGVKPPWIRIPVKPMQWAGSACEAICLPLGISPPLYRRRVDFFTKDRSFSAAKAQRELGFVPAQALEQEVADIVSDYKARGWL